MKLSPANLNSPEQTVISGNAAAREARRGNRVAGGAKRAVILAGVRAISLRDDGARAGRLETDLRRSNFTACEFPLVTNVDADTSKPAATKRAMRLIRQVTLPVRWQDSVREMIDQGVNTFVEVGPGRVLTGLLRQIDRSVRASTSRMNESRQAPSKRSLQLARKPRKNFCSSSCWDPT